MEQKIQLTLNNNSVIIDGHLKKEVYQLLKHELGYLPEDAIFQIQNSPNKFGKEWDGRVTTVCYNKQWCKCPIKTDGTHFPTGLTSRALKFFKGLDIPYSIIDSRQKYEKNLFLEMSDDFEIRDYQTEVIEKAIKAERGIIKLATGSGKTSISSCIIKSLGVYPFIFYVTSIDLLQQAYDEFTKFLRKDGSKLEVGVIGDGICDIRDINIMTVQTAIKCCGEKYIKNDEEESISSEKNILEERNKDILDLIHSAKGFMNDECQHVAAKTCQTIAGHSTSARYRYGLSVFPDSKVDMISNNVKLSLTIEMMWDVLKSSNNFEYYEEDGYQILNLNDIKSRGFDGAKFCWKNVNKIFRHINDRKSYSIKTFFGKEIKLTEDHSIFTIRGDIIEVKPTELKIGDLVLIDENQIENIVEIKEIPSNEGYVYDLEMSGHPSFVANGILVHNSGTPYRDLADDILIEACFGRTIADINASYLIKRNYLVKPYINFVSIDKSSSNITAHTYPKVYDKAIINNEFRNEWIAEAANRMASQGRTILILVRNINHGNILKEMVPKSEFIYGINTKDERLDHLNKIRCKEASVTLATSIMDEGVDCRSLDTLILAGSGKSRTRALQRVGRVLRPYKNKTSAIVIDFDDNFKYVKEHSAERRRIYKTEEEFDIKDIEGV